jgi:ABC-type nitrate/sulfonate/bicarbonate transport system substrate-binding protein
MIKNKQIVPKQLKIAFGIYSAVFSACWLCLEPLGVFGLADGFLKSHGFVGYVLLFTLPAGPALAYLVYKRWHPDLHPITICQFHRCLPYLALYVAEAKGFFRENGISVTFMESYGDHSAWNKVKNGEAEFGVADPLVMVTDPDTKGRVVASILGKLSLDGLTRKPYLPMNSISDLNGKTIAVFERPSTSYMIAQKIAKELQSKGGNIKIREMKPGTELTILTDPEIDVVFTVDPTTTIAVDDGARIVFSCSNVFGDCLTTGLFATERFVKENPDVVQRVVNAIERSLCFVRENPIGTLEVAAHFFPDSHNLSVERGTLRLLAESVISKHSTILENSWQICLRLRAEDKSFQYPFSDFVDNSFAARAVEDNRRRNE